MSCISSNFSSFFLNSLNDPSEFSKYLSNGELKCSNFEEFQVFGCGAGAAPQSQSQSPSMLQQQQQQQQSLQYSTHSAADFPPFEPATQAAALQQRDTCPGSIAASSTGSGSNPLNASYAEATAAAAPTPALGSAAGAGHGPGAGAAHPTGNNRWPTAVATPNGHAPASTASAGPGSVPQHFDGSFEFIKYLRHSADFTPSTPGSQHAESPEKSVGGGSKPGMAAGTPPPPAQSPVASGLIDLDTSTSQKSRSASRKVAALLSSVSRASNSLVDTSSSALDVFDHDSKQTIFDLQHMTSNGSSNSNESSLEMLAFPNSHLNASNSNTSSEGAACGSAGEFGGLLTGGASCSSSTASSTSHAPKLLGSFVIKENFEVHPSHKVEEGIFQHMNKLPSKKKDTLKQLGVRFTGQMTLTDKSIVVENFIKFCEEYDIKDHRPWLSLNQCGLNKPEQIKFARYLGQGLPTFTLFCIYSNFKNLFCTKRTEIYTKDGYNLPYILDKTKRFLANTTAGDNANNNNNITTTTNTTNTTTTTTTTTSNSNNTANNNKVNTTTTSSTSTTTPSTPVKQAPQHHQQQQPPSEPEAPESPASTPRPAGAGTPTQPGGGMGSRGRPVTPTMSGGGNVGPSTPQSHLQHHQQQQQQQQQQQPQHQQQQSHQQHMLQHPHTHSHPHAPPHPHAHSHASPHPHPPHSLPHHHPHPHPHHLQPGTPTRSPAMAPHPHHYSPHPHPHAHHQPPPPSPHGHPHAHHYAYAHPQQHHPHYYPHPPHPHSHVQHMAAMGYPAPPPQQQQQQQPGGAGAGAGAAAAAAAGATAAGGAGAGGAAM